MTESSATAHSAEMLIGGSWVSSGDTIDVVNPADRRDVVGNVPRGTEQHVGRAAAAAADSFPVWSRVPMKDRAAILRLAAERLRNASPEVGVLLARESGYLLSDAAAATPRCADILDYYAAVGETYEDETALPSRNGRVIVYRQPMGVAALIVPWNGPTSLGFLGLAPILLAGNTVVIKPPSQAPLALTEAVRAIADLFPPGTINTVTGSGLEVGKALVTHPLVRKINFTGSTETGAAIMRDAAATMKRLTLELGGNDAAVVMADVDLDHVVPELVAGAFGLSGQVCYNVKRIYVHRSIHDEFAERYGAVTDSYVVGNGLDPAATMGPLISKGQVRWVTSLVEEAQESGGAVRRLGQPLDEATWPLGNFMLPIVVTGLDPTASLVRCEQFGPVVPILPFDGEDEAIALVNDSDYGLTSSLWMRDEERAFELARRVEAGSTFINVHRRGASGIDMPFGGFKLSGIGRGHGVIAVDEQLELHTISSRRPGA